MIEQLPNEVLYNILFFLPTAKENRSVRLGLRPFGFFFIFIYKQKVNRRWCRVAKTFSLHSSYFNIGVPTKQNEKRFFVTNNYWSRSLTFRFFFGKKKITTSG